MNKQTAIGLWRAWRFHLAHCLKSAALVVIVPVAFVIGWLASACSFGMVNLIPPPPAAPPAPSKEDWREDWKPHARN